MRPYHSLVDLDQVETRDRHRRRLFIFFSGCKSLASLSINSLCFISSSVSSPYSFPAAHSGVAGQGDWGLRTPTHHKGDVICEIFINSMKIFWCRGTPLQPMWFNAEVSLWATLDQFSCKNASASAGHRPQNLYGALPLDSTGGPLSFRPPTLDFHLAKPVYAPGCQAALSN